MKFCRVCLFALAFCACTPALNQRVADATDATRKVADAADCARVVSDSYATADVKKPEVALGLAADLKKCVEPAKAAIDAVKQAAKPAKK
jgi:hypothetical protein